MLGIGDGSVKFRGRSRHWLVIVLQGPRRPWWLAPMLVWVGTALAVFGASAWGRSWVGVVALPVGVAAALTGAVWWRMRVAEWQHYRRFAMEEVWEVCPRCAYSLEGLADERCPECGEDLVKLRRTLARRRSEWF